MLLSIIPKIPMRNKEMTEVFYQKLGFTRLGSNDFKDYLIVQRDGCELHFFLFEELEIAENYGQIYIRTDSVSEIYHEFIDSGIRIHPNGSLEKKLWGQMEFSVLDPDNNLITFGQKM